MKRRSLQNLQTQIDRKRSRENKENLALKKMPSIEKMKNRIEKEKIAQQNYNRHNQALEMRKVTDKKQKSHERIIHRKETGSQNRIPFVNIQHNLQRNQFEFSDFKTERKIPNKVPFDGQTADRFQPRTKKVIEEGPPIRRKNSSKSLFIKEKKPVQVAQRKQEKISMRNPLPPQNQNQPFKRAADLTQLPLPIPPSIPERKIQNFPTLQALHPQKNYPINLKTEQIGQSQRNRIRNLKFSVQNSDKVKQDGTIPIKLVLVGDGSVGKTSMLISYTTDNFPTQYVPTIFDNYVADIKMGSDMVKLWLWDTAGQQQYAQLRLISYQKADIFFICFSMIDQTSFHNAIDKWFSQVQQECPKAIKIFVGTKSDLHKEYLEDPQNVHKAIPLDYIEKKCEGRKCIFMPCSGLNQKGLNEVFNKGMSLVVQRVKRRKKDSEPGCQII